MFRLGTQKLEHEFFSENFACLAGRKIGAGESVQMCTLIPLQNIGGLIGGKYRFGENMWNILVEIHSTQKLDLSVGLWDYPDC